MEDSKMDGALDHLDTAELLALYKQTGEEQIKWQIVLRYEQLVKNVAMQARGLYSGFTQMEDIIQEGLLTLLKAIDKYDPKKGVKFETFVSKRIRGMVVDLARKQDWVPRSVRKRAKEIDDAVAALSNELGRYPTNAEMANFLDVTEDKYQKELAGIAVNNVVSLEALMDAGDPESYHMEIASGNTSEMPDWALEEQEKTEVLTKAISSLQENEQIVLSLYYVENLRLKDIAHIMDVSEPRVSQIHTRAIGKLRKELMSYYNMGGSSTHREKVHKNV